MARVQPQSRSRAQPFREGAGNAGTRGGAHPASPPPAGGRLCACQCTLSSPCRGSPGEGEGGGLCNGDCWRGAVSAPSRLPAAVAPPRRSASSGLKATGERAPLRGSEGAQCPAPVFSLRRLGLAAPVCARGSLCSCTPSVSPQCHTWVKAARNKPFRKTFTSVLPYCLSFRALRGAAKLNFQHRGTCS